MRTNAQREGGQAAVETAIIAPLFVFIMLGILQMNLIFQARAMLKYAAYRAARAGAMQNACNDDMVKASIAALVPVIPLTGKLLKASDPVSYGTALLQVRWNRYPPTHSASFMPIVEVRICGPLRGWLQGSETNRIANNNEVDFDDPKNLAPTSISSGGSSNGATLRGFERTKLRIQVKFNYRMFIPFANYVIYQAWMGIRESQVMRMNDRAGFMGVSSPTNAQLKGSYDVGTRAAVENSFRLRGEYLAHNYFLPIYANYAFRMQSNFFMTRCQLPTTNRCWHYNDGSSTGAP